MRFDTGKLIDAFNSDNHNSDDFLDDSNSDDDGIVEHNSSNESGTDSSISMSDSSDEESNETSNLQNATATSSTSRSNEQSSIDIDDDDDDVVKAIVNSKELHRNHPPQLTMDEYVADICFHPVNDIIAIANMTGDVLLYSYNNEETSQIAQLELHLKACRDIEFSNDGKTLFSTAKDLSIMLTDVETEKLKRVYENAHEQPVYTMAVIGEHVIATGDDNGVVKLWDLRKQGNEAVFSLKEMEDYVSSMISNSDGKYLVCASGDGSLTTLNIPAKKLHVQSEEYDEELTCLGLFKSERKILACSSKGKMYVYNWGEFGLHSDEFPSLTKKAINCLVPITENVVITGGEDGMLRATSLFPHRHLGIVGQHDFSIEALDISNDGTLIASTSHDNDVKFWNCQYFESLDVNERIKGGKQKCMKYNLPSSKVNNASDFFADL